MTVQAPPCLQAELRGQFNHPYWLNMLKIIARTNSMSNPWDGINHKELDYDTPFQRDIFDSQQLPYRARQN